MMLDLAGVSFQAVFIITGQSHVNVLHVMGTLMQHIARMPASAAAVALCTILPASRVMIERQM